MNITLSHSIQYEVKDSVAIEDLIKSLDANAKLLREAADFISDMVPGLRLATEKVSIRELSQGSPLREVFALALVLAFQKDLEKEVPELVEYLTGVKIPDQYDTLVTVLVMLIALYGISKAFDLLFPGKDKTPVDDTRESLITQAAKMLGTTAEAVRARLVSLFATKRERALITAGQRMFAPTRGQLGAVITDASGSVLVSAEAVGIAQSASGLPIEERDLDRPHTSHAFHRNVRIILHAMDRDRKKSGWAAHVPGLFENRIPMDLEKTVDPELIFGASEFRGDILLTLEESDDGEMLPKEILLVQAYPPETPETSN